jgi:hypothetical protein
VLATVQVHSNIVVFQLRKTSPLSRDELIRALHERSILVIPFRYLSFHKSVTCHFEYMKLLK